MDSILIVNIAILNVLVGALLVVVLRQQRGPKKVERGQLDRLTKPIHHPKVAGPTSAQAGRGISYWRQKDDANAEPILVAWYEKDTTPERWYQKDTAGDPEAVIPADTYVDLTGRKIPGPKFRSVYEPAEEVMVVAKVQPKTKLRSSTIVSGSAEDTLTLSPEEEDKLAAEYELGGGSP
jgi:hypothetical protein